MVRPNRSRQMQIEFKVGMLLLAVREPMMIATRGLFDGTLIERREYREHPWKLVAVDGPILVLESVHGYSVGTRRIVSSTDYTFVEVQPETLAMLTTPAVQS